MAFKIFTVLESEEIIKKNLNLFIVNNIVNSLNFENLEGIVMNFIKILRLTTITYGMHISASRMNKRI